MGLREFTPPGARESRSQVRVIKSHIGCQSLNYVVGVGEQIDEIRR